MFKKIIGYIILILFCISCGESPTGYNDNDSVIPIDVYSIAETDRNDYYLYPYIGYNYGSIYFITEPLTLVHWDSPDEYCYIWWGEEISEPVIDFSTYSDGGDGTGQQNFYMNETFIGDTLKIIGYINSESYDIIDLIIIDGR